MRGYINSSEQLAELARIRRIRANENLQAATFTAADYGNAVLYTPPGPRDARYNVRGVLRQRFAARPENGTAVFVPCNGSEPFHVTPDEVTYIGL